MDIDLNDHGESDSTNGDGEGVWSPDIEQCFREALLLFPPCGRRKHILQEEGGGKMYGRNELIARHIMMRTGKSRTRKQVSSHIQVLARRKAKAEAASNSSSGVSPSPSAGVVSLATSASSASSRPQSQPTTTATTTTTTTTIDRQTGSLQIVASDHVQSRGQAANPYYDIWVDRAIATQKIRLVEFSAFIEYRNFQQTSGNAVGINNNNSNHQALVTSAANSAVLAALSTGVSGAATNIEPSQDLSGLPQQQQLQASSYPLASNHHLPAQFNQASYMATNNNKQLQPNQQLLQQQQQQLQQHQSHSAQGGHCAIPVANSHQLQQPQLSAGFTRHSYVKIDYRLGGGGAGNRQQANLLEKIAISQIQDKFPEIGGSEGLFQRGPSDAFFLIKFWADLNNDYEYNIEDQNSYFGFSSHFETVDPYRDITCSTKACSYGCQVVEKVEKIYGAFNSSNGRYSYEISRSPMCEFMVQFIKKLRELPRASQMNSVLENFTVLQVITRESTPEILLCLAYVFEVAATTSSISQQNNGPQYHVYKLTRD